MNKFIIVLIVIMSFVSTLWIAKKFHPDNPQRGVLKGGYGQMPLYFVEKEGSGYFVQGRDKVLFFTPSGVVFSLSDSKKDSSNRWNIKADFVGANPKARPLGQDPTPAVISYFKGPRSSWKTGLKTYGSLLYRDLWPGIDLVYQGNGIRLEYEFIVHSGADPSQIKLAYSGAEKIFLNQKGEMEIETPLGGFKDERPKTYQEIAGEKREIDSSFLLADSTYGFQIGPYDKSRTLVIDPATLIYAGFIGGSGQEQDQNNSTGFGIAVDSSGNAYVTGSTTSTELLAKPFPVATGPDSTQNGGLDAFVAKVNSTGTALTYAGFIGGSGSDIGMGIAVDSSGNAYVAGQTSSSAATFPVTVGPDLSHNGGTEDAFVAKVNSNGTSLTYAGYIGGSASDIGYAIAVDTSGSAYVAGRADSTEATFPETSGSFDTTQNGGADAFVAKVSADGSSLTYAGYIGGASTDIAFGIALDGSGNAYVTGETGSSEVTFPVTVGPDLTYNSTSSGDYDAFVAKINSTGSALTYCGYVGGTGTSDVAHGIAVDSSGNAYITGRTNSTESTGFPVSVGPDLTYNGGSGDIFVAKVNSTGMALSYAGYIGGTGNEYGQGIAVDSSGNAYVTGLTASTESTFPVVSGPDLTQNGGNDAFVAKVNSTGTALSYAGYIGGTGNDYGFGIALDSSANVYVVGNTDSTESSFPVSGGPSLTQNGSNDAFVAKISIVASCGDSIVEGSETCDDGNSVNTDACLNTCVTAACGDGVVRTGVEGCDDGNSSNTDACLNTCVSATCGDGSVQSSVEACDNGGSNSNTVANACRTNCTAARCGDSVVDRGEACDDGNSVQTDACLNTCAAASCGDGFVRAGVEECDAGGTTSATCSTTCQTVTATQTVQTTSGGSSGDSGTTDGSGTTVAATPLFEASGGCSLVRKTSRL